MSGSSSWRPPAPKQIGSLRANELEPILERLLECPSNLVSQLGRQSAAAIGELDQDSRPDTYEGLCDVARYCVEDDPGWNLQDRRLLVGGHPEIGATLASISEESRKEQLKGGEANQETIDRLRRLNALYRKRYPGLTFVTYVAGRPRNVIADEIEALLGPEVVEEKVDPADFPESLAIQPESKRWQAELERGSEALWQIAYDRAKKLAAEAAAAASSSSSVPASTPSAAQASTLQSGTEEKEEPFITLATFRMLALSSPVLETFFEKDLSASFQLTAPERSESGGAFAWHAAPVLPNSPRAIPGADNFADRQDAAMGQAAAYSRDVTTGARGKVVGFLGGLLGEEGKARMERLADTVSQRLQTHSVTGPVPSFGRDRTLDGTRMDTGELREKEEERRKQAADERSASFGARLAGVVSRGRAAVSSAPTASPTPTPAPMLPPRGRVDTLAGEDEKRANKRNSVRGTDLSEVGPTAAVEALRQAALQERSHFVIDEVSSKDAARDGAAAEDDLAIDEENSVLEGLDEGTEAGRLSGKEAQLAKDLRSAPAQ